jgi:hypothetical protein
VRISSTEKYNEKAYSPNSTGKATPPQDPKVNRAAVAKQYGLSPDEMDRAIRAWGRKTTDPYEAAQAALYEGNFSKASVLFQDLLKQREEKLGADQRTVTQDQNQVYNAAFF